MSGSALERFANMLLAEMPGRRATHLRIAPGGLPSALAYRVDGHWTGGPIITSGAPVAFAKALLDQHASYAQIDPRAAYGLGTVRMHFGGSAAEPKRGRNATFEVFYAQLEIRNAIVFEAVHDGADDVDSWDAEQEITSGRTALDENDATRACGELEGAVAAAAELGAQATLARAWYWLAIAREAAGDFDRAREEYARSLDIAHADSRDCSITAMFAFLGMGELDIRRGDAAGAITPLTRAREIADELVGAPHAFVGPALELARAERKLGSSDAMNALREALARAERHQDSRVSAFALHELGIGAFEIGDLDDAARCLRRALSLLEGERTLRAAEIEVALSRILFARGRPQEGMSLMLHASEIVSEVLTPNHPSRLEIERELGRIERPGSPYR